MSIIEVRHMAPLKKNMYQHLRSAKEWLTKAEEAFDKEHDVRAELDLMLAQAELQHVKEANRSRQWRYKYLVFRHGAALTLAVFMAVAIGGGVWWMNKPEMTIPVPLAQQVNLPVEVVAKAEVKVAPVQVETKPNIPVTVPVTKVAQSTLVPGQSKAEEVQKPKQASYRSEPAVVVSEDEMQKMVRAAGKSLRGQ